jgi:hypothetical protein
LFVLAPAQLKVKEGKTRFCGLRLLTKGQVVLEQGKQSGGIAVAGLNPLKGNLDGNQRCCCCCG